MTILNCPALFIAAPASGQGKTTVTAALARFHRNRGRCVRVFKTGADFLDPMILERASSQPVYSLDPRNVNSNCTTQTHFLPLAQHEPVR